MVPVGIRRRTGVMYQDYFGIEENPFSLTPNPRYLYMAKGHQEALAHLLYGVTEGGGFVMLTGEVGTGKTSVCRCLLEQLPDQVQVALILNPRLNEIELLSNICDELGVKHPKSGSLKVLVDRLNAHFLKLHSEGRHAVLIIDEAQNLSPEVLEQVRLLTNLETTERKLLQIILVGQPELSELLNRKELRQLAQRISARYHLNPLNAAETKACITHRLGVAGLDAAIFGPGARAEIYKRSRGVPRLINSLCDRCLLAAYVQETKRVDRKMVHAAAAEVFGGRPRSGGRGWRFLPWTVAAGALAMLAVLLVPSDLRLPDWASALASKLTILADARAPDTADPPAVDPQAAGPPAVDPPAAGPPAADPLADQLATTDLDPVAAPAAVPAAAQETRQEIAKIAEPTSGNAPSDAPPTPAVAAPTPATPTPPTPTGAAPTRAATAGQAPTGAAPPITLDQLFALDQQTGDRQAGLVHLFDRWQIDFNALAGSEACAKARQGDLRCLRGKGNVEILRTLNRPALLPLEPPGNQRIHAVLTGLDGAWLTLQIGEHRIRASATEIAQVWTGEYLLLWRPPRSYRQALKRGQSGANVAWLKKRLAELRGESLEVAADATFDAALEDQVIAFQLSRSLEVDGIVGAHTLIQLSNAVGDSDVAMLRSGS